MRSSRAKVHKNMGKIQWSIACICMCIGVFFYAMCPQLVFAEQPKIEFTPEERAWMKEHPVIRFPSTTEFTMPPIYSWDPTGRYVGIGVDLAELVVKRSGLKIEWVPYTTQVTAIDALVNHEIDAVSFMGESMPGEGTRYLLSDFTQYFPSLIIVPKDTHGAVSLED